MDIFYLSEYVISNGTHIEVLKSFELVTSMKFSKNVDVKYYFSVASVLFYVFILCCNNTCTCGMVC